jgi:hypothetical protein
MSDFKTTCTRPVRVDANTTTVVGRRGMVGTARRVDGGWQATTASGLVSPVYRRRGDATLAAVAEELAAVRGGRVEWPTDTA